MTMTAAGSPARPGGYGPAQRLYARRGYLPDSRGAWHGQEPLRHGVQVTMDHDLILWLTKALR
jgi:hypothetical protein